MCHCERYFQDRVVAIPKEFQEPTVLRKEHISQFQFCDVESNDMR